MGTPEFAAQQLHALYENKDGHGWEIVGAVSQPDKPKGRGHKLAPTPVKIEAEQNSIPVYQPETLKDGAFEETLRALDPDLIVVAAYGKILPGYVLDYPKYGCINVHGSLLPAYRGAAPIQRAIMDGLTETGVTIMYMAAGLDTGDMIDTCVVPIGENEDFGTLYDEMGKAGAELLIKVIPTLENGTAVRTVQDDALANYAHKIEKAECALDFSMEAKALHDKIRGLSPTPLGFVGLSHDGSMSTVKIVSTEVVKADGEHGTPGLILEADAKASRFTVACGKGVIAVTALVPEGKGRMSAGDFIRGRKIAAGDVLIKKEL